MKIKFGAIVVDGRGKIGGHVASKNRAGAYIRTKVTPVNPGTVCQAAVRNRFAAVSVAWRGLTAAQRILWNDAVAAFAKTDIFGDLRHPSGANLHQRLNNNLLKIGEAVITVPPVPAAVAGLESLSFTAANGGAMTLAFAETPTVAGHVLVVKGTPAISPGISFVKSELREFDELPAATATDYVATVPYEAKFGDIGAAGQKIIIEAFYVNMTTGQAGVPLQASAIIT